MEPTIPPADPLLAWVMAQLDAAEESDGMPQTQLINEQGTEIQ